MTNLQSALLKRVRPALAATVLAVSGVVHAAVNTPVDPSTFADYGENGNIFQLEPLLYVQGLGSADRPEIVVALNSNLHFAAAVAGWGTSLVTIEYRVSNSSASASFTDLRFMVYANPDGDPVNYLDVLSEAWGLAATGDPVAREGRAFVNPADSILSNARSNNKLTEGYDANCLVSAGCDATVGLQWNAATLGPGESFFIRVGLSDDGQQLSSRWIDATSVASPADTKLRLSGVSSITAVPEPATVWMLLAGLYGLGAAARYRARR